MTPKQQRFIDAYLVKPHAEQAALAAGYSPRSVRKSASQVLGKTRHIIAARLAEAAERANITLDSHIATLAQLRDTANALGQMGAAVTAETNRGKAAGLYVERSESKSLGKQDIRVHFVTEDGGVPSTSQSRAAVSRID